MPTRIINPYAQLKVSLTDALPDPVTVPYGGLGLTDFAHGDVIYGSASNVLSRLARDDGGLRALTNQGSSNNPHWDDPSSLALASLILSRKVGSTQWGIGTTGANNVTWGSSLTDGAAGAFAPDANDTWRKFTTVNSSASVSGYRTAGNICWLDNNPKIKIRILTGSVVTNLRLWFILSSATAVLSNSDDQHALKGVGLRFSTSAGDAGFVPWTSDGTTQTIGSSILAVAINTVYLITISVSGATVSYTINSSTGTASVPSAALGTMMRVNAEAMTLTASTKDMSIGVVYGEWD